MRLSELEKQLTSSKEESEKLATQADNCEKKLVRARKLIEGLGGEKDRWQGEANRLGARLEALTGDVLLTSGFIAYLGAFTSTFRERCMARWTTLIREAEISCTCSVPSEGPNSLIKGNVPDTENTAFSLVQVLGEPVKIRSWTMCGLPPDEFSIENGILVDYAQRFGERRKIYLSCLRY